MLRLNQIGPRKAAVVKLDLTLAASLFGKRRRSQTAYTFPAWSSVGSAVIDCLSLKAFASVSRITISGRVQVRPPSVDLLASRAWSKSSKPSKSWNGGVVSCMSLKEREIWCSVPSGPNEIHGSVVRW